MNNFTITKKKRYGTFGVSGSVSITYSTRMGDHWVEIPLEQIIEHSKSKSHIFWTESLKMQGWKYCRTPATSVNSASFNAKVSNIHTEMLVVLDIYFDLMNMYV